MNFLAYNINAHVKMSLVLLVLTIATIQFTTARASNQSCKWNSISACSDNSICDAATRRNKEGALTWFPTAKGVWVNEAIVRGLSCGLEAQPKPSCEKYHPSLCDDKAICTKVANSFANSENVNPFVMEAINRGLDCDKKTADLSSGLTRIGKGVDVRKAQSLLVDLCFNPGPITGVWNSQTNEAFKSFYSRIGKFDGNFDHFMMRILSGVRNGTLNTKVEHCRKKYDFKSSDLKIIYDLKSSDLKIITADENFYAYKTQEFLARLCFNPGPVDGIWGQKTERAFRKFFSDIGKDYDGDFTYDEMKILSDFFEKTDNQNKCKLSQNSNDLDINLDGNTPINKLFDKALRLSKSAYKRTLKQNASARRQEIVAAAGPKTKGFVFKGYSNEDIATARKVLKKNKNKIEEYRTAQREKATKDPIVENKNIGSKKFSIVYVPDTIYVPSGTVFDGEGRIFVWIGEGNCSQDEGMPAMFRIEAGSHIKNLFMIDAPDGIHFRGNDASADKIVNLDVCEDAMSSRKMPNIKNITISNSSFYNGADKCLQVDRIRSGLTVIGNRFIRCAQPILINKFMTDFWSSDNKITGAKDYYRLFQFNEESREWLLLD